MPSTTLFEATTAPAAPPTAPSGPPSTPRHAGAGVHHFNRIAVLALPVGVLLSVLTTQDPLWWQQHFSQLGTFGDASSRTFNSTVMFSGFFLAAYGVLVAIALPSRTGRRARRAFRIAMTSAGLHLSLVGVIPIPVSPVMHDLIASGLGLSFLGIVATSLALPGRSRRFRRATGFCVALLATGMVVLTAGVITLALFEFVAFVSMGIWLTALPRALAYTGPSPTTRRLARRRARRIARAGRRMSAAQRPPMRQARAVTSPVTAGSAQPSASRLPGVAAVPAPTAPTDCAGTARHAVGRGTRRIGTTPSLTSIRRAPVRARMAHPAPATPQRRATGAASLSRPASSTGRTHPRRRAGSRRRSASTRATSSRRSPVH